MRFLPRSLLGQVMLSVTAALLIAQAVSTVLLYRAAEQRREIDVVNSVAFQLIRGSDGREHRRERPDAAEPPPQRGRDAATSRPTPRLPRAMRYTETVESPLRQADRRNARAEGDLKEVLSAQGIAVADLALFTRPAVDDPTTMAYLARFPRIRARLAAHPFDLTIAALRQQGSSTWQVVRLPEPRRDPMIFRSLMFQTLLQLVLLLGLLYFVLRRITRPLATLADRTKRFAGAGAAEEPLEPTGPEDVRRLIEAHNAMQARIGTMLDEKDVMLGAIGHDLKTPLAALRVRIEGVEDETARTRMAATIEEITRTLDDILSLARVGRSDGLAEPTDLGALAASVVEEFEDMDQPVTLVDGPRVTAPVHLTWLKRGLRNLVSNALRYAGSAEVSVLREGNQAILRVADRGPGIPEGRIADMLEPFTRGEASRNRETGGAGLGLTLARAVAEQHGGTLVLANRSGGGLTAELRIPLAR